MYMLVLALELIGLVLDVIKYALAICVHYDLPRVARNEQMPLMP